MSELDLSDEQIEEVIDIPLPMTKETLRLIVKRRVDGQYLTVDDLNGFSRQLDKASEELDELNGLATFEDLTMQLEQWGNRNKLIIKGVEII